MENFHCGLLTKNGGIAPARGTPDDRDVDESQQAIAFNFARELESKVFEKIMEKVPIPEVSNRRGVVDVASAELDTESGSK